MSEKARELIEEWVTEWEQQNKPLASSTSSGKVRGKKKKQDD